jgi:hypothetical protein
VTMAIAWTFLSVFNVFEEELSLGFPATVSDQYYHGQVVTTLKQSAYVVITNIIMIVFAYEALSFLQFLPMKNVSKYSNSAKFGTKFHYRLGFFLALLPILIGVIVLTVFLYNLSLGEVPEDNRTSSCTLPIWSFVPPIVVVVPGFVLFLFAHTERMRWGAMTALAVDIIVMGLTLWVLSFFYCFAHSYTHILAWVLEAGGMVLLLYCALRPNVLRFEDEGALIDPRTLYEMKKKEKKRMKEEMKRQKKAERKERRRKEKAERKAKERQQRRRGIISSTRERTTEGIRNALHLGRKKKKVTIATDHHQESTNDEETLSKSQSTLARMLRASTPRISVMSSRLSVHYPINSIDDAISGFYSDDDVNTSRTSTAVDKDSSSSSSSSDSSGDERYASSRFSDRGSGVYSDHGIIFTDTNEENNNHNDNNDNNNDTGSDTGGGTSEHSPLIPSNRPNNNNNNNNFRPFAPSGLRISSRDNDISASQV